MQARLDVSLAAADYGPLAPPPGGTISSSVGYYQIGPTVGAIAVTGVAATDIFTSAAHQLQNGQAIWFDGRVPFTGGAGLSTNTVYYIINSTTNTFQLALTPGGSAINFTTDLTVATAITPYTTTTHTITMGPQRGGEYWTIERVTVANDSTAHVPTANIYKTVINPSALIDYTPAGTGDVNDLSSPTFIGPGDRVVIVFEGSDVPGPSGIIRSTVYLGGTISR